MSDAPACPSRRGVFRWLAVSAALPAALALNAAAAPLQPPRREHPDRFKVPHFKCGCEIVE